MSASGASSEYVVARRALLDAFAALEEHLPALILVGAQAIYLYTGEADVAISTRTDDGDVAVEPDRLGEDPLLEELLASAGFMRKIGGQPGEWIDAGGVQVDLLVPESLGGPGKRAARIPPHETGVARKVVGLEAAIVENELMRIGALDEADARTFEVRVARPGALLVAKLHKLGERAEEERRLIDKDAHDIYRLLRAVSTDLIVDELKRLLASELASEATQTACGYLRELFGTAESAGSVMAGRAEELVGDPAQVAAAVAVLTSDMLERI